MTFRFAAAALAVSSIAAPLGSGPGPARLPSLDASCAPNLADRLASTGPAHQLITVVAPSFSSTTATLSAWRRVGRCWALEFAPTLADVGESGLSNHHVEGDGTTPTGSYGIGPVMFGTLPNPGVAFRYHQLVCGDWWDEDPSSDRYNTFVHLPCGATPPFGGGSEALWQEAPAYDHFAVIEYNAHPVVDGRGSAIFLHVSTGLPTSGCVAIAGGALDRLIVWLRPRDAPHIVIGTRATITTY